MQWCYENYYSNTRHGIRSYTCKSSMTRAGCAEPDSLWLEKMLPSLFSGALSSTAQAVSLFG